MINEPIANGNLIAQKNYAIDTGNDCVNSCASSGELGNLAYPIAAPIAVKTFTEASTNVACRSVMLIS